jgi:ketosteroid isomerase-like protein
MDHDALMALHMRMMADPEIHAAMRADAEMQALMVDVMPEMDHGQMQGMDHGGMDHAMPMDPDAMMAQMRERMGAMTEAEHAAFMTRFEAAHRRLLATPAVHMRAMADPELRRMMEAMPGGMPGMGNGSMDGMDHSQMDHSQMQGMDHPQMGQMSDADRAAGVALQRRNAGAPALNNGDERIQGSAVGPAEFAASETADRFHAALAAGDRTAMEAILAPDAVVLEGGRTESRAEYLSHHFARDAEFLAGASPEPLYRRTGVAGDAAWVASTQRLGDVEMAELLVMKRTPDGWRVAAVHWSSAR